MEALSDDELVLIFEQLNQRAMMSAIKSCRRFAQTFSNSEYLMKKFYFQVTSLNLDYQLEAMPSIAIRNLVFFDLGINTRGLKFGGGLRPPSEPLEKLLKLIDRFGDSVESLELKNFRCDNENTLVTILSRMRNLKELKIGDSWMFEYNSDAVVEDLPEITFASLTNSSEFFFDFLMNFKLESVEANGIIRLEFLKSQLGVLKELKVNKLPNDSDGDEVWRFIRDDMKLKSFSFCGVAFIKEGQKLRDFTRNRVLI